MDLVFCLLRIGGHLYCDGIHVFPVGTEDVEVRVVRWEDPGNSVVDSEVDAAVEDNTVGEDCGEVVDLVRIGVCVPKGIEDKDFQVDSLLSVVFRKVY